MEDLMWGELPKQRVRKEEKFSTAVLTMAAVEKVGGGRKFVFNKAAQTDLEIVGEDRISFGFDKVNNVIAVRKSNTDKSLQLTKTCTVSNKEWFEFIAKHFGLNIEAENNFDLIATNNYFTLSLRVLDNDSNNIVETVVLAEESPVIEFHTTDLGEVSDEEVVEEEEVILTDSYEDLEVKEEEEISETELDEEW
jgi:ribosomal protein S4E